MLSIGVYCEEEAEDIRDMLEPIFHKYGVSSYHYLPLIILVSLKQQEKKATSKHNFFSVLGHRLTSYSKLMSIHTKGFGLCMMVRYSIEYLCCLAAHVMVE